MAKRCDCCDLPVESCGKAAEQRARQEDANARSQALAQPGWFQAQWPGQCGVCGVWFKAGDPITRMDLMENRYKSYCCS